MSVGAGGVLLRGGCSAEDMASSLVAQMLVACSSRVQGSNSLDLGPLAEKGSMYLEIAPHPSVALLV